VIEGAGFPKETDKLTRVDEKGVETEVSEDAKATEVTGRAQTGRTGDREATSARSQPQPEPARTAPPAPGNVRTELPRTSSSTPLVALLGFASLLFAAAVRGSTHFRF
jgi:hypothetical protein